MVIFTTEDIFRYYQHELKKLRKMQNASVVFELLTGNSKWALFEVQDFQRIRIKGIRVRYTEFIISVYIN